MKNIILGLLLAVFCLSSTHTFAQTADTTLYIVYGYHKVAPEHKESFLKLAKAWKKIVEYKKKSNLQSNWSISRITVPSGESAEYNYVTRHTFVGKVQMANYLENSFLPEGWQKLLTVEEIDLILRDDEIRTFVKNEVYSEIDDISGPDISKSKVVVYNFYKQPEGKTQDDHIKMEQEIWKPIHAARIKDGKMTGWFLMSLEFPYGSSLGYDMVTADAYLDAVQMLTPWFSAYFKKIHPTKDIKQLMKRTNEDTNLVRSEIRILIDRLD